MKTLTFLRPGELEIVDVPMPEPAPGEALVRLQSVGICGTDLGGLRGKVPFFSYPRIPGHELCAEVVEAPAGQSRVAPGDLATVNPMITCGKCYPCRIGRRNCCVEMKVFGVHVDGGFREYFSLPVEMLHRLPQGFPLEVACMCEPLSIGFQANARGEVSTDDTVLIIGAGAIGLMCLLVAKMRGARVLVSDLVPGKLELAARLGADAVVDVRDGALVDQVMTLTEGEGASMVIEAVGVPETIASSVEVASPAGRVVLLGITSKPVQFDPSVFVKKELDFRGSRLNQDLFPEAIEHIASSTIDLRPLVSHRFPFADARAAFEQALERPIETVKVVVDAQKPTARA